ASGAFVSGSVVEGLNPTPSAQDSGTSFVVRLRTQLPGTEPKTINYFGGGRDIFGNFIASDTIAAGSARSDDKAGPVIFEADAAHPGAAYFLGTPGVVNKTVADDLLTLTFSEAITPTSQALSGFVAGGGP